MVKKKDFMARRAIFSARKIQEHIRDAYGNAGIEYWQKALSETRWCEETAVIQVKSFKDDDPCFDKEYQDLLEKEFGKFADGEGCIEVEHDLLLPERKIKKKRNKS